MTKKPELTLYNSLTRKKEVFTPQDPKRVTMYNCGPTVYSYAHIGNARAAVVADVLFRVLRHIYGEDHVIYARNITDVDDRIIQNAKETGRPISEITEKYARIYNEDLAAIGCLPPTEQPKCTAHIDNMSAMITQLLEKGFAYESDGHVFFDVSKYDDYGQLSGNNLESLRGGNRVGEGEVARKRNAADFVLWKPELDGVGWDAPFGKGRPGWHIECSAMAKAVLTDGTDSETIDIHCGGVDLKFPHHENEIAQSNCAHDGAPLANYWVHNEFLNMGSEKMSKSIGNVKLINHLIKDWDGEVVRVALQKAKYSEILNWTPALLGEAQANLQYLYSTLQFQKKYIPQDLQPSATFTRLILDDLNTSGAIMELMKLAGEANSKIYRLEQSLPSIISANDGGLVELHKSGFVRDYYNATEHQRQEMLDNETKEIAQLLGQLKASSNILGLLQKDPEDWFKGGASSDEEAEFDAIALRRQEARAAKDWAAADAARDEATARGIVLEDGPDGTNWRKA